MRAISEEKIKKYLSEEYECYVLITCRKSKNHTLDVEMDFDGDPCTAACLLQGAAQRLEEQHLCVGEPEPQELYVIDRNG